MTIEELKKRLEKTGIPVAYNSFRYKIDPPFICFLQTESVNFFADGEVYYSHGKYRVELYTDKKSIDLQSRIEAVLLGLTWERNESFIEKEEIYQIVYEVEV